MFENKAYTQKERLATHLTTGGLALADTVKCIEVALAGKLSWEDPVIVVAAPSAMYLIAKTLLGTKTPGPEAQEIN